MCVIANKPAGFTFDKTTIQDFYNTNRDGLGIMWVEDGEVRTHKSLPKSTKDAWTIYSALAPKIHDKQAVLHFRLATNGSTNTSNCHPFPVTSDGSVWMAHNGVLDVKGLRLDTSGDITDTLTYIRQYLTPLVEGNPDIVHQQSFLDMVGTHIGGSKFVFLTADDRIEIANKHRGDTIEREGRRIWVSNLNWDYSPMSWDYYRTPTKTAKATDQIAYRDPAPAKVKSKPSLSSTEVIQLRDYLARVDALFAVYGKEVGNEDLFLTDEEVTDFWKAVGADWADEILEEALTGETPLRDFVSYIAHGTYEDDLDALDYNLYGEDDDEDEEGDRWYDPPRDRDQAGDEFFATQTQLGARSATRNAM